MTTELTTDRTRIRLLEGHEAQMLLRYYLENREHLAPWEPERRDDFFMLAHAQSVVAENTRLYKAGLAFRFAILNREQTEIIGLCNITNLVMGIFKAANLGYSVAERYQGQGYMSEALRALLDFVFHEVGLNRVMANYMPNNEKSARLLASLGFEREGYAKSYLKIAGEWQDHVLTAKLNPNRDKV
ncbi:ribosomal protein S5-alanine N-acetyltransferase [Shewanella loihica]|uniref:GCN5-related N-acetyltransferase n=1 Tax=Shewanella loihica (strain ATCC BAA-1088 / PV-4) TaxID=323850 RepID=A3Q9H2_SHELP|nr:ribosomal protein S5-alanine N-acetyltransferase [Shewanella loihica]ABO22120.1 GCN5-related N-acetyltransferase [Shewanella loihica PV-4]